MKSSSFTRRNFLTHVGAGATCVGLAPYLSRAANRIKHATATGYAFDPNFAQFGTNGGDVPQRVVWINNMITESGLIDDVSRITPLDSPLHTIQEVHEESHIAGIQSVASPQSGYLYGKGEIAELAAGYVLGAVQAVCDGTLKNAFCNIRPPGHHVINGGYTLGYCCYGNVAIAAQYALEQPGINRVLIIDWDYHQGNGTHSLICGNDNILFFETFQPYMYSTECNDLNVVGPNGTASPDWNRINVRIPPGAGNDLFQRVFEEKLVSAADNFKPDLVLISCGFDLKYMDSHGDFQVTSHGISRLTKIVQSIADTHAKGRIVSMLEGGYGDVAYSLSCERPYSATFHGLAACAESHLATLATGEVQEESAFYKKPARFLCETAANKRMHRADDSHHPRLHGSMLDWRHIDRGVSSVTVFDLNGAVAGRFNPRLYGVNRIDLREITSVRGRYVVKVLFGDGEIWAGSWVLG